MYFSVASAIVDSAEEAHLPKVPVISIVDDDESVLGSTKELVRSLGYIAATFSSAEEFLKSNRLDDTSCIIADVQMPGLGGLELQSRLIDAGYQMPIIFVTAFPEDRTRTRATKAGAFGFLSKPFSDESLIGCLDRALACRKTGASNNSASEKD
jgi:FixJ family two-component response regulator